MALSKALIGQFKALHLARYGEQISDENAEIKLKELAELVRITTPVKESRNAKTSHNRSQRSSTSKRGI